MYARAIVKTRSWLLGRIREVSVDLLLRSELDPGGKRSVAGLAVGSVTPGAQVAPCTGNEWSDSAGGVVVCRAGRTDVTSISPTAAIAALPIATWEFSMGVYLTFSGFKDCPITAVPLRAT
jgi:hypothetical protein